MSEPNSKPKQPLVRIYCMSCTHQVSARSADAAFEALKDHCRLAHNAVPDWHAETGPMLTASEMA